MQAIRIAALVVAATVLALPASAQQDFITTFIGGGPADMPAVDANLNGPAGVATDSAGNLYIAAYYQNRIFKVSSGGTITVLAGLGIAGYSGDGVTGGAGMATLNGPEGIAVDSSGNVYFSDYNNFVIRKIDTSHTITTVAGTAGACGYNGDGAPATSFHVCHVYGVAADHAGNLFLGDTGNCRVRKLVLATDTISTYAGNGSCAFAGDGGLATSASVNQATGVAADTAGNIIIADNLNRRIREVNVASGIITTVAGNGTYGFAGDGGPATIAEMSNVYYLTVNGAGTTVTFADYNNLRVRQFTVGGNISTIAGSGSGGFCGDGGPATSACLNLPEGVVVTQAGLVYVADTNNERVRSFTVGGTIGTVAGNGSTTQPTLISGVAPTGVVLNNPLGVTGDPSGDVWVGDSNNYMVRELVHSQNLVDFFAGTGVRGDTCSGETALTAQLNSAYSVARDKAGNIYIADPTSQIICQVNTSGIITTFAGKPGSAGFSGDGGLATAAQLYNPYGVWVDSKNNVYIADYSNQRIREVTNGIITTIAGNGVAGFLGDGDPAIAAELRNPGSVTTDGLGNIYIADTSNCRIRKITAGTGIITTVAGTGTCNFSGDGIAVENNINNPAGIISDVNGNLFFTDTNNQRVRWVDPSGNMTTIAGDGTAGYTGDGVIATSAELYFPWGIYQDANGNYLIADEDNERVRQIQAFAALSASDNSLSFGLVPVGSTGTPQTVTLSAVGPVSIYSISATGDFTESDDCGSTLANQSTCTMYVYFTPKAAGNRSGTVMIDYNGLFSSANTIALTGTGTAISLAGSPISFGSQAAKTVSAPKSVTVTNTSNTGVTMGAITLNETTDFVITSNTCPAAGATFAAHATCTIAVEFKPQTTGVKKGAVLINDSDPSSPQIVGLTGTGTSTVALTPNSLTFAAQPVGTTSSPSKITLTNNTGVTLNLGNPALSFTGPFKLSNATSCTNGLAIVSGGTCAIYVLFAPTVVGYPSGTLSVMDNNPASPQTVPLAGTATAVLFTPSSINFGTSNVGVRVSSSVTITNVGTTRITFNDASIVGPNSPDFSSGATNPPCGGSLAPGAVCSFSMYFTPSKVGAESATYQVFDNSAGSPQSLALTGTGQ